MNKDFKFSWKFKDFEVRTVFQDESSKHRRLRKNCPVELVKHFDGRHSSCYVVAWFELDEEGYELHFVGNRPLKDIDADEMKAIWSQLQAVQKMLDAYFEACGEGEEY